MTANGIQAERFFSYALGETQKSTEKMSESDNRQEKTTEKAPDSLKCGVLHSNPALVGRKSGPQERPDADFCTISM